MNSDIHESTTRRTHKELLCLLFDISDRHVGQLLQDHSFSKYHSDAPTSAYTDYVREMVHLLRTSVSERGDEIRAIYGR